MDPVSGYLIGGLGSGLIGGIGNLLGANASNETNLEIANRATQFNEAEANRNRQFQMDMSNTAYQRATADMTKAGINPMLAAMKGGASTPGGAQAQAATTRVENAMSGVMDNVQRGVNSALDSLRVKNEGRRLVNDMKVGDAEANLKSAQAEVARSSLGKIAAEISKTRADEKVSYAQQQEIMGRTQRLNEGFQAYKSEQALKRDEADYARDYYKLKFWLDQAKKGSSTAKDIFNIVD